MMIANNSDLQHDFASVSPRRTAVQGRICALCQYVALVVLLLNSNHLLACPVENKTIAIMIKGHELATEVAASRGSHMCGLAHRQVLAPDQGMLFVYTRDRIVSFWMKNTYVPLSIAYLDSERRILEIHDMDPATPTRVYKSKSPVRYALEVNKGWFSARGITAGDTVEFDPEAHPGIFSY